MPDQNPIEATFGQAQACMEQAQGHLWNARHTLDLEHRDDQTVAKIIEGINALSRQLSSYQEWMRPFLPAREGGV